MLLMAGILCGLLIALDVPTILSAQTRPDQRWIEGVLFALLGAAIFGGAMWVSENRLAGIGGTVRSMLTMALVFIGASIVSVAHILPAELSLPTTTKGGRLGVPCVVLWRRILHAIRMHAEAGYCT